MKNTFSYRAKNARRAKAHCCHLRAKIRAQKNNSHKIDIQIVSLFFLFTSLMFSLYHVKSTWANDHQDSYCSMEV